MCALGRGREYSLGIALATLYCIFSGESGSSGPPVTHLLEPMDRFAHFVKGVNKNVSVATDNKLYPIPTSIYTNLAVQ